MSTPVLTKQQRKHSLSAKKGSAKGLKNVLSQPQDSYWPVVPAEKCPALEEVLNRLLPAVKRQSHSIPWSQLRHMKKQERSQAKKEALLKEPITQNSDIINSVVLGINSITRSLEKNNVCSVLVDAHIVPQLLVKHLIQMAQNKNVPILLLPQLKTVTINTIGFASAACALKNVVMESPEHYFHQLYETIYDIFKDIPVPKNRLILFKGVETPEKSVLPEEGKMCSDNESEACSSEPEKFVLSTDVYLYRSSRQERVFVPPSATSSSENETTKGNVETEGFISLGNYDSDENDPSITKNTRYINIHEDNASKEAKNYSKKNIKYLPLKVKRLQGNPNRAKATKISKKKKN